MSWNDPYEPALVAFRYPKQFIPKAPSENQQDSQGCVRLKFFKGKGITSLLFISMTRTLGNDSTAQIHGTTDIFS